MIRDSVPSSRSGDFVRQLPRSNNGTIDFSVLNLLSFGTCRLVLVLFQMAGNLTAILPLDDLSFPGLAGVSYVKLLAALAALPAVVIILNVLSQLVRAFCPNLS